MRVLATREGLVGHNTSSGWIIDTTRLFVALPNIKALRHKIRILNPLNGKMCDAEILDVGPWNIDDPYADPSYPHLGQPRPLSEKGIKTNGRERIKGKTNKAGIDLGEAVWNALDMKDNGEVDWIWL